MKRTIKLQCPNCKTTNQRMLGADIVDKKPQILCVKCSKHFHCDVAERFYYMGQQTAKINKQFLLELQKRMT